MSAEKTYFCYYDQFNSRYFYYDVDSHESVWKYPMDGFVYDPETYMPVYPPQSNGNDWSGAMPRLMTVEDIHSIFLAHSHVTPRPAQPKAETPMDTSPKPVDAQPITPQVQAPAVPSAPSHVDSVASQSFAQYDREVFEVTSFIEEQIKVFKGWPNFEKLVDQAFSNPDKFRKKMKGKEKDRKPSGILLKETEKDKEASSGTKALVKALVNYLTKPHDEGNNLSDVYKVIVEKSDIVVAGKEKDNVRYVYTGPLVDEAYAQVLAVCHDKQGIPVNGLQLLLLLTTFFRPQIPQKSKWLTESVYSFAANQTLDGLTQEIKDYGAVILLRFESIMNDNERSFFFVQPEIPDDKKKELTIPELKRSIVDSEVNALGSHASTQRLFMNVSIAEIMHFQVRQLPHLPIPKMLVTVTEKLLSFPDVFTREGLFRISGSKTEITKMCRFAEIGDHRLLESGQLYEWADFFKKWLGSIPGQLITNKELNDKIKPKNVSEYIAVADQLDPARRYALMYVIGFLRDMSKKAQSNKMDIGNLAMCFSIALGKTDRSCPEDQSYIKKFVVALLENWDVSKVYPLPPELVNP